MNAQELLEKLTDAYAHRDSVNLEKQQSIPPEVKKILDDIESEFSDKLESINASIAELEAQAKQAVLESGETTKGGALQAVYSKGRVSWDNKKLDGMMIVLPQLKEARKEGEPSVSIRKIG